MPRQIQNLSIEEFQSEISRGRASTKVADRLFFSDQEKMSNAIEVLKLASQNLESSGEWAALEIVVQVIESIESNEAVLERLSEILGVE